mgnify:CR=1 FL=1
MRGTTALTRTELGGFIRPLPPSARIDTLLLGCTHYPLLRTVLQAAVGERVAIVDSATATASALVDILEMNGLEAPGTSRGTAADPGKAGHSRPEDPYAQPVHRQLTTGDAAPFRETAIRLFGEEQLDVESIELRSQPPGPG